MIKRSNIIKNTPLWMLIVFLSLLQVAFSYLFEGTKGLLKKSYLIKGDTIYVTELLSSGADDNISISFGYILFAILAVYYLVRQKVTQTGKAILFLILLIQFFFIILIEVGSIIDTIFYGKNYILFLWVINYFLLTYILFQSFSKEKQGI